jgi:DNA polymerase V
MSRGGARPGAGRRLGSGKFGVATKAVRIPINEVEKVMEWVSHNGYRLPFFEHTISAGFPSAGDDAKEELDLNELLIAHPTATFFLRVSGMSMIKAGIHDKDILIVDRSLEPVHGKIVIATLNGELTVKRLYKKGNKVKLIAENDAYSPIDISPETDFRIWGVVTSVIHPV